MIDRGLVWFRRDLRVDDHPALARAARECRALWCVFVLDRPLLDPLPRADRRVEFIRDGLTDLETRLSAAAGGGPRLIVLHGDARDEIPRLAAILDVSAVHASHDDDPFALARDSAVRRALADEGRRLVTSKDHVVFERDEILTAAGGPYVVFTPYHHAWMKALHARSDALAPHIATRLREALAPWPASLARPWRHGAAVPSLDEFGFERTDLTRLGLPSGIAGGEAMLDEFLDRVDDYARLRDYPARAGTSHLGAHLRFGTVSIRHAAAAAHERVVAGSAGAETWLKELAWRDFYQQILYHYPHVVARAFRDDAEAIAWDEGPAADALFEAWCAGRTGYPLVDAGLRQLVRTGYMHNRLRMVTASFLTKDLGVSWRRGEAWFARWLLDYELASNNGGWQWAASTGCDAQPWFRVFNPVTQSERFDPDGAFIHRLVPELQDLPAPLVHAPWTARPVDLAAAGLRLGETYPEPIVDHDLARRRTLARFGRRTTPAPGRRTRGSSRGA